MAKKKIIIKKYDLKVDLSVPSIDDSISMAKDFVDALVLPALSETGLLVKDYITAWRFKNQVKIVNRSRQLCELNGINPKTISLKLLAPLLDNASLEEDIYLQEKWALLLTNLVDSRQNIENHVFPYLLSQISKDEFVFLENSLQKQQQLIDGLEIELEAHRLPIELELKELNNQKERFSKEMQKLDTTDQPAYNLAKYELQNKIRSCDSSIRHLEYDHKTKDLKNKILAQEFISVSLLHEYEVANLIRLGILRITQRPYAKEKQIEFPEREKTVWVDFEIELDIEDYSFTELGKRFIQACSDTNL